MSNKDVAHKNQGQHYATQLVAVSAWIAGVVIAKGFWSTAASIIFPPWAWYLLIELVMTKSGLL